MDYEHDDRRAADVPGAPGAEETGLPAGREPHRADSSSPRSPEARAFDPLDGYGQGPSSDPIASHGLAGSSGSGSSHSDDLFDAMFLSGGGGYPPAFAAVDHDLGFPPPQAPDLASAFLAALDAIDDRRFVTPVPEEPPAARVAPAEPASADPAIANTATGDVKAEPAYELRPQSQLELESAARHEPVDETPAAPDGVRGVEGVEPLPWDTPAREPVPGLLTARESEAAPASVERAAESHIEDLAYHEHRESSEQIAEAEYFAAGRVDQEEEVEEREDALVDEELMLLSNADLAAALDAEPRSADPVRDADAAAAEAAADVATAAFGGDTLSADTPGAATQSDADADAEARVLAALALAEAEAEAEAAARAEAEAAAAAKAASDAAAAAFGADTPIADSPGAATLSDADADAEARVLAALALAGAEAEAEAAARAEADAPGAAKAASDAAATGFGADTFSPDTPGAATLSPADADAEAEVLAALALAETEAEAAAAAKAASEAAVAAFSADNFSADPLSTDTPGAATLSAADADAEAEVLAALALAEAEAEAEAAARAHAEAAAAAKAASDTAGAALGANSFSADTLDTDTLSDADADAEEEVLAALALAEAEAEAEAAARAEAEAPAVANAASDAALIANNFSAVTLGADTLGDADAEDLADLAEKAAAADVDAGFEELGLEDAGLDDAAFDIAALQEAGFDEAEIEAAMSAGLAFDDSLTDDDDLELEPAIGMDPIDAAPMAFDGPDAFAPAAAVAAQAEPEPEPESDELEDLQDYVVFSLGDMRCVVPIRNVVEVGRIPDAAPVPNAPAWLYGLGNLRGQVLSLIDLRAFFGVGRIKASTGRMVVLRGDADDITAGVMVDQVHQIVALSPSRFKDAPAALPLPDRSTGFVWGACDYGNFTMIGLDVDGVLGVEGLTEEDGVTAV